MCQGEPIKWHLWNTTRAAADNLHSSLINQGEVCFCRHFTNPSKNGTRWHFQGRPLDCTAYQRAVDSAPVIDNVMIFSTSTAASWDISNELWSAGSENCLDYEIIYDLHRPKELNSDCELCRGNKNPLTRYKRLYSGFYEVQHGSECQWIIIIITLLSSSVK